MRLVLSPADAQRIAGRALTVDVSYLPLPVNAGSSLAISAEGAGPVKWATRPTPPQAGTLRFELPPQANAEAIGIRAISTAAAKPRTYWNSFVQMHFNGRQLWKVFL